MPSFRGYPACTCLAEWLPVFEAELKRRGVIKNSIDVAQLIGSAPQSAATHKPGGAFDIWQHDATTVKIAREMGAAAWARTRAQGFDPHTHGVLNGCPHNSGGRYQIRALKLGRNGLGWAGLGGKDDGPAPRSLRTWREGIKWAKAKAVPSADIRFATYNLPGADKLPHPAERIASAVALVKSGAPSFVGWNELVGIRAPGKASDFAHDVDAALGNGWNLIKPTRSLNENYISYQTSLLELVHQYDDSILEARTGGRHLTRVVFKDKKSGLVFAVGQTHLVNDGGTQGERDRQTQAADALASMKAVSAKHGNCPIIIQGDMNTAAGLTALTKAGMKRTRTYADNSTTRSATTYTNIAKTKPSTDPDWIIDQQYVSGSFYCVGYTVRRSLDKKTGKYAGLRASDHELVVSSVRT